MTTVGLPLRDDLLIRSLVQVIGTQTADSWTFHDGFEADVALCNPNSSLAGIALRRAEHDDALTCVSVVHDGDESLPGTRVLHAPVKSLELISLLNEVSHVAAHARRAPPAHHAEMEGAVYRTADLLHELMRAKSPDLHAVECGEVTVFLVPATRAFYAAEPPTETELAHWLTGREARVRRVTEASAQRIVAHAQNRRDLDALLWRAGLEGSGDALLPAMRAGAKFKLKRWPDFGRLVHQSFHFRMAALLSRGSYDLEELAAASTHTAAEARAFINACAICDLLLIDVPVPAEPARPPPPRRYSSILNSIRSALGLRT